MDVGAVGWSESTFTPSLGGIEMLIYFLMLSLGDVIGCLKAVDDRAEMRMMVTGKLC
jgi:hypothetical protein